MYIKFVAYGVLATAIVFIVQRRDWTLAAKTISAVVFFVVLVLVLFWTRSPEFLDESQWYQLSPYREFTLFVLMLLGMSARYMTKAIEVRREKISRLIEQGDSTTKPPLEFDAWEFSYPMFASVVTYGGLLSQIGDEALTLSNVILSFQTGFFWQTVLAKEQPKN